MKKKGFTLIELLVVIAIIAMLLAILMPALNKVKKIAQRVVCGTNLKGLGTAHRVYANDYDDAFAVQNGAGWNIVTGGFNNVAKPWPSPAAITVGSSLYLLVREADVSPKSFVCGAGGQSAYEGENTVGLDIVELWDFGVYLAGTATQSPDDGISQDHGPKNHVSYSYQMPYGPTGGAGRYAADGTRSAAFAVMADKNPWMDSKLGPPPATVNDWQDRVRQIWPYWTGPAEKWTINVQNAYPHDREGQNVQYADGHSAYEKVTDVGVKHDQIYLIRRDATEDGIRQGNFATRPVIDATLQPLTSEDSFLVNDDFLGP